MKLTCLNCGSSNLECIICGSKLEYPLSPMKLNVASRYVKSRQEEIADKQELLEDIFKTSSLSPDLLLEKLKPRPENKIDQQKNNLTTEKEETVKICPTCNSQNLKCLYCKSSLYYQPSQKRLILIGTYSIKYPVNRQEKITEQHDVLEDLFRTNSLSPNLVPENLKTKKEDLSVQTDDDLDNSLSPLPAKQEDEPLNQQITINQELSFHEEKICPYCNRFHGVNAKFCGITGKPISIKVEMLRCHFCGGLHDRDLVYCTTTGKKIKDIFDKQDEKEEKKTTIKKYKEEAYQDAIVKYERYKESLAELDEILYSRLRREIKEDVEIIRKKLLK